jgi:hypothetical protein
MAVKPLRPDTVKEYVPAGVVPSLLIVNVLSPVPPLVVEPEVGEIEKVTPAGVNNPQVNVSPLKVPEGWPTFKS